MSMADVDSQFGLGLGTQYGGLAGIKYSATMDNDKIYLGAGLASPSSDRNIAYGISIGWEKALTDKHALGLAVRTKKREGGGYRSYWDSDATPPTHIHAKKRYESFVAATYTYYFNNAYEAGFLTGLSAGKTYMNTNVKKEFESGMEYGLYFGYQF
ncbi:hypothetical protein ACFQH7_10090 [Microbulbifer taiwanensis]